MKRIVAIILVLALICCFAGCDDASNNISGDGNSSYGDTNYNDNNYDDTSTSTSIQYISDRRVQYDDTNNYHIVFFGLQDAANT